jgi:hypothetical protein
MNQHVFTIIARNLNPDDIEKMLLIPTVKGKWNVDWANRWLRKTRRKYTRPGKCVTRLEVIDHIPECDLEKWGHLVVDLKILWRGADPNRLAKYIKPTSLTAYNCGFKMFKTIKTLKTKIVEGAYKDTYMPNLEHIKLVQYDVNNELKMLFPECNYPKLRSFKNHSYCSIDGVISNNICSKTAKAIIAQKLPSKPSPNIIGIDDTSPMISSNYYSIDSVEMFPNLKIINSKNATLNCISPIIEHIKCNKTAIVDYRGFTSLKYFKCMSYEHSVFTCDKLDRLDLSSGIAKNKTIKIKGKIKHLSTNNFDEIIIDNVPDIIKIINHQITINGLDPWVWAKKVNCKLIIDSYSSMKYLLYPKDRIVELGLYGIDGAIDITEYPNLKSCECNEVILKDNHPVKYLIVRRIFGKATLPNLKILYVKHRSNMPIAPKLCKFGPGDFFDAKRWLMDWYPCLYYIEI